MLILFSSDLHGYELLYENLIALCDEYYPDIVLLGGDLFPKFENTNNLFLTQKKFANNKLPVFLSKIKSLSNSKIGIMLGNDDFSSLKETLLPFQDQNIFTFIDNKIWDTGLGWYVVGFNFVPETPFSLKDFERLDKPNSDIKYNKINSIVSIRKKLTSIDTRSWFLNNHSISEELSNISAVSDHKKTIFVSHAPPYNTPLDMLFDKTHVGSKAIRSYIENTQPAICFHGHIHESFHVTKKYYTNIGDSICFNPGQVHIPKLDAVLVDTNCPFTCHRHTCGLEDPSKEGLRFLKPPFQT